MKTTPATIEYKTKVKTFDGGEQYIDYKVNVGKTDCNLKPCQHAYYNSDMFDSMLKRAVVAAQDKKKWCRLSELPACVSVDTSKFMAVVTIQIEV